MSRLLTAGSVVVAANILVTAPASASGVSVRKLAAQEARVATIAHRMAVANSYACSRPSIMHGMILHDLTRYRPEMRPAVSRAFSLNSGLGVVQLVAGSAASRAGLRIDDEIIAVGNVGVEDPASVRRSGQSFGRMEMFSAVLQSGLRYGRVPLFVRRRGQLLRIDLAAERGCGGQLTLENSPTVNAWADGKHIMMTTGMTHFARSNDELAFVIAHEMAHNILGHAHGSNASAARFGILGSRSRNLELDADSYAVRLMSSAGYQPAAGIRFLEHSRRRFWWAFSLGHPGFGRRIKSVAAAIAGLRGTLGHPYGTWQIAQRAAPAPFGTGSHVGAVSYSPSALNVVATTTRAAPMMTSAPPGARPKV
jgi:hypothetical protein